ncbi:MAG TPA: TonB-dependent receptor [Croceibacterium sp.]|nr:TonB-dependent receptor [Croceibacterium sp.]
MADGRCALRNTPLAFTASISALAIALTAAPAAAQDDEGQAASGEIIVTAQFREQRLQDTPLAITAVDAAMLAARNQDDIADIARQAPSVTLNEMGGAYGASMGASIRGIGQFDFNPAYEPGVGLYVDDVYYPTLTGANFDLLDLERVEILRGPQGTLTGRNSIGGAIKLFSKKPNATPSAFVEGSYGSRDRMELRGGVNFPIAEGLYSRISAVHKEQDGYVDQIDYGCANPGNPEGIASQTGAADCVVADLGNINYSGVRASVLAEPTDNVELLIIADYQRSKRNSAAEVPIVATGDTSNFLCGRFCTYASWQMPAMGVMGDWNTGNTNLFKGWGVSGHLTIDLNDSLQFQSITAYREYNNIWGTDDDFTPTLNRSAAGYNDLDFWFVSQELRLNGKIGDFLDFTVGGFYSDQRSTYFTIQDIRYIIPGVAAQFRGNDPINADSKAGFATVIIKPTDGFTLTGGIRYTDEHKDYTFVRLAPDGTPLVADPLNLKLLNGVQSVYDGDRFDWRVSADYRFSPELMAYVTVGTGFKGGGVTARPFLPQHAIDGTFDPETVTSYEAGIKTDLFGRLARFNVSGFYNEYKNIQLGLSDCSAYGGGPCAVIANAGDGKIWGVEAELFAEPTDGLMIDGSLSLLDSKYTTLSPAVGTSTTLDDPIVSPKVTFSGGVQYEIGLSNEGSLTPRFDVSYRGKAFAGYGLDLVSTDYRYYDAYWLGNARLTYRNPDRDLEVALEVTNLFDKYYMPGRFDAVYAFAGTAYAQVGKPREWRVSVRKDF